MSTLRLLGLLIGVGTIGFALGWFRGPRWNRTNFYLFVVIGLALATLSLAPGLANVLPELFNVGSFEFGRLLSVLILATGFALSVALYNKAKLDALRYQVDRVFCAWAADDLLPPDASSRLKPITVIMPALNEAMNLEEVLPRVPKSIGDYEVGVLVIDDGSEDDTTAVALRFGAAVARNPVPRGQGAASRVGYRVLQKHRIEFGITMDSDGQHRPEDLPIMVQPILDGKYDLVIGSRILGSHTRESLARHIGVHLLSRILSAAIGVKITDCSSGFKAFRMSQLRKILLTEDQFQASEILVRAAKKNLRIGEAPIHIAARGSGTSRKGRNVTYGLFFFKALVKAWLS